jgi:hypothetical protein
MTYEQGIEVQRGNPPDGCTFTCRVHNECCRALCQGFPVKPERVTGEEDLRPHLEEPDAPRGMARDVDAEEPPDMVTIVQEDIRPDGLWPHDFAGDTEKQPLYPGVSWLGNVSRNKPGIGLVDGKPCPGCGIFQRSNAAGVVHMEMRQDNGINFRRVPAHHVADERENLRPALRQSCIDYRQVLAGDDVAVGIDPIYLVDVRYDLYALTLWSAWNVPGD